MAIAVIAIANCGRSYNDFNSRFISVKIFHSTFEINEEHMIYVYMVLSIIGCVFLACTL